MTPDKTMDEVAEKLTDEILFTVYVENDEAHWGCDYPKALQAAKYALIAMNEQGRQQGLSEAQVIVENANLKLKELVGGHSNVRSILIDLLAAEIRALKEKKI